MEAETEMSLPKIVKDRFNRLEKEINEDNLTEEMQVWLKQMGMTKESLKADFIPAKPEKQKLTKHYYHTDQIGTPLALITEKGEKAWEIITDPYGRRVREENPNKLYQPIRMQGQHYDAESNLHYNRYRYYDPNIGRYISQDPIGLQGGINNYIYPLNPNQVVDPLGLVAPAIFWGIGIAVGIGGGAIATSPGIEDAGGIDLKPDPTIPSLIILGSTILWNKLFSSSEVRDKTCTGSNSSGNNDDRCNKKLDKGLLKAAGLLGGEHEIKEEYMGSGNNSQYDICGCKDGRIVIKGRGCKGNEVGEAVYGHFWK